MSALAFSGTLSGLSLSISAQRPDHPKTKGLAVRKLGKKLPVRSTPVRVINDLTAAENPGKKAATATAINNPTTTPPLDIVLFPSAARSLETICR
jgi:hypothetical protein